MPPQGTGLSRPEQYLRATLQALRADYEQDRVRTFEEAVHAHVFRDLFEQATHLLEANLLLAAAVVAGAAFEQHLRHLAARNGIALTDSRGRSKAGSAFNTELRTQANAYDIAVERQNQVWIDYRNQAAHNNAEFQNRTADQIRGMIQGARDFATQHPA